MLLRPLIVLLLVTLCPVARSAEKPIVFSRSILPLFQTRCLACHSGQNAASGYSMETREKLIAGGRHGAAVVVGKGAQSNLVKYLTGELKPKMPPGPDVMDMQQVALVRRWIDEGAKVDGMNRPVEPKKPAVIRPTLLLPAARDEPAPVTALAYAPDGKMLAAGGFRAVRLIDPASGQVVRTLHGPADQIQALAWSRDGNWLAAAGGVPGERGEIALFDARTWKLARILSGHAEVVYTIAFKPDSSELASGALDKTVRIWDVQSGNCRKTLTDFADAVFGVDYAPDGRLLAAGGADRFTKLFDTTGWKGLAVLGGHSDAVTRVAFSPDGKLLATASADKSVRVWEVKIGNMENPARTQYVDRPLTALAFSPDGKTMAIGAADDRVRVFNGDGGQHLKNWERIGDWVYSLAFGSDSGLVTAGTQDGRVLFFQWAEDKVVRAVTLLSTRKTVSESSPTISTAH